MGTGQLGSAYRPTQDPSEVVTVHERRDSRHLPQQALLGLLRAASDLNMHARVRPRRFGSFGRHSYIRPPMTVVGSPDRIQIGDNVSFGSHATLSAVSELHGRSYDPLIAIGDSCSFGEQLFISCCGAIEIGREVMSSARVVLTDNYHGYEDPSVPPIYQPLSEPQPVRVGDGVFLGVGCVVLPGVTLGERAYVGANSVVTRDVPAWTLVAGNPARPLRRWNGSEWVSIASAPDESGQPLAPTPPR
jgi:acetyltransferase-like isoleucine patch superfamily enzyme